MATQKPDGTVHDAEQDFINCTNKAKSKIAYDFSVTGRTILLRDGQFPISRKAAAIGYLNSNEGTWTWTPRLRGASVANDFAFVVGNMQGKQSKAKNRMAITCACGCGMRAVKHHYAGLSRPKC